MRVIVRCIDTKELSQSYLNYSGLTAAYFRSLVVGQFQYSNGRCTLQRSNSCCYSKIAFLCQQPYWQAPQKPQRNVSHIRLQCGWCSSWPVWHRLVTDSQPLHKRRVRYSFKACSKAGLSPWAHKGHCQCYRTAAVRLNRAETGISPSSTSLASMALQWNARVVALFCSWREVYVPIHKNKILVAVMRLDLLWHDRHLR